MKTNLQKSAEVNQEAITRSKLYGNPIINSALTTYSIHNKSIDLTTITNEFENQANQIIGGDIAAIEKVLASQALSLNAIYNRMAVTMSSSDTLHQFQVYSDVALKAQNQCRKTLLALAEIKNPKKATFVKQQNVAFNQQVNNGNPENLKNTAKPTNELLSEIKHETLDFGGTSETIRGNSQMEAVGALHRGKD